MIGLWKHVVHPPTSGASWRCVYFATSHNLVSKTSSHNSVVPPVPGVTSELDMRNTRQAYASKSLSELVRAYVVFRLCSYETLIKYQKELLNFTRRMLGRRLFRCAMRMSVYGQFMAGEDPDEILKVAYRHHAHNVRPMFAYTASEKHGAAQGMLGSNPCDDLFNTNHKAMQECIEMAKLSPKLPNEYVKVTGKLTALGLSDIFRDTTTLIKANTDLVKVTLQEAGRSTHWRNIRYVIEQLVTSHGEGSLSSVAKETGFPLPANYRTLDWRSLVTCQAFHLVVSRCTEITSLLNEVEGHIVRHCPLSAEQEGELLCVWRRMDDLAQRSLVADVCLVVDAEQTYLQASMDLLSLDLMRKYNTNRPVVHTTYQCYLTRAYDVITRDLASADAEGFLLGAKVVRGGYLDEERALAVKHGYPDPVNPTFEATTTMYYKVAEELLTRHTRGATVQAMFATHNEATVKHILGLMKDNRVTTDPNVFSFAQLIGMRDHIAFTLGQNNLPAKKLLHYGDVEDCVAYLSRRLTENRSGVPTANVERTMLAAEIGRRLRSGEFFWRKSV